MKKLVLGQMLLLAQMVLSQGHKVELTVQGIDTAAGGSIQAGLFNDASTKWDPSTSFMSIRAKVEKGTMKLIFENVPEGTYAAAVFHDIDDNGELKRNFFTIPKEPVGFSNGQRIRLGAPGFQKCSFPVDSGTAKEIVLVEY